MVDPVILDTRACRWCEYVDEATTGTFPTNPTMKAFPGIITGFDWMHDPVLDDYNALNGPTCTTPREHGRSDKVAEDLGFTVSFKPTALTLFPYVLMGATTSTYAIGTTPHYISVGMNIGSDYATFNGCLVEEVQYKFSSRSKDAEATASIIPLNFSGWGVTDYKGTGTHAAAITDAPYNYGSVSSLSIESGTFEAANMILNSLNFGFKNDLQAIENVGGSFSSKNSIFSIGDLEKNLELGVTFLDAEVYDTLRAGSAFDVSFTLGGKTFAYTNIEFDKMGTQKVTPADSLGATLKIKPTVGTVTIT
jgi:hypothetical protein